MITENPSSEKEVNKFKQLARFVIEHHFGTRPSRISFKASGLTNFVFGVKHREGEFVVRISPDAASINLFIKEQWAQSAAREAGVPTAEILEVGSAIIPHPYMISRRVSGVDGVRHNKRNGIIREMGHFASVINGIRTKGYGATFDWSNNKLSRNETWKDYLRNEYRWHEKLNSLERHRVIRPAQAKKLKRTLLDAEKMKPKATLNHGDIRLKNVIADDDGKITAVIDWENATSNAAPYWELSLSLHDLGIDEQQHFIEGYGISRRKFADASFLIKAFNILNYAPEVDRLFNEKDKDHLDRIRDRMSGSFDLYSL